MALYEFIKNTTSGRLGKVRNLNPDSEQVKILTRLKAIKLVEPDAEAEKAKQEAEAAEKAKQEAEAAEKARETKPAPAAKARETKGGK